MRKALLLSIGFAFLATGLFAQVKSDPAELTTADLTKYFEKRRNLDRFLQTGQWGMAIKVGKEILKDLVTEDAYAAYCIGAAYASMDEVEDEDYYAESLEYIEKAIEWGFRNVQTLDTSNFFNNVRSHKEKRAEFDKLVKGLKKKVQDEAAQEMRDYPERVKKAIGQSKKQPLKLGEKDIAGQPLKLEAGKPILAVVIRPQHEGVLSSIQEIRKTAARAKEKGVSVVGVIYNYEWSPRLTKEALGFAASNKLEFPCVPVDRAWAKEYMILNLPAFMLAGADSKMLFKIDGYLEEWRLAALVDVLAASK